MKRCAWALMLSTMMVACGEDATPPAGPTSDVPGESSPGSEDATGTKAPAPKTDTPAPARAPQTSDLFSKTFGDAKNQPVIFVHGGPGSNSFDFESSAAQALADRGFFVVTYDQRGCGRSPKGDIAEYRYSKAGDDLDDLIFTLKLEKPVLLGHSFGGSVALNYLDAHPGRAKGVVLAGSPIDFPAMYHTILEGSQEAYMSRFMKPKADEMKTLEDEMFPNGLEGPFTYSTDQIVECTKAMMESGLALTRFPSPGALGIRAQMQREDSELANAFNGEVGEGYQRNDKVGYTDFTPLLAKHEGSVWAAYGDEDGIFDEAQLASIKASIGADHFQSIERASHFSYVDNAEAFVDVVSSQLNAMK